MGTSEIESFPSYICRLGQLHGLTISTFLKMIRTWWARNPGGQPLPKNPLYQRGGGIFCGVGVGVHRYVEALKVATGASFLERTTFISLTQAISPQCIGLSGTSRAWCPACFLEHKASGSIYYDRLLWCLAAVKRCPIHKVALVSHCHHCGLLQEFCHRDGGLGLCWKCSRELLTEPDHWKIELNPSFGERDCIELVEAIGNGDLVSAYPRAFQVFFSEVLRHAPQKKRLRFGREMFGLANDNSRALRIQSPQFSTMLRSSHATGVRLVDILIDPVNAAEVAGGMLVDRVDGRSTRAPHKPKYVLDFCAKRLQLELIRPDGEYIPSLSKLAVELGVGLGFLHYRFPDLIRRYEQKRSRQKAQFAAKRTMTMQKALEAGPLREFPSARYPTQESLAYAVMEKCGVGRRAARIAVRLALSGRGNHSTKGYFLINSSR